MSWSLGYDATWERWIGYGVPAFCDHPKCGAKIDRGLSHVCGGEPYGGDTGCGLYFCGAHLFMCGKRANNGETVVHQHCARCRDRKRPFRATLEHPDWLEHMLTDPTWAEYRTQHQINAAHPIGRDVKGEGNGNQQGTT